MSSTQHLSSISFQRWRTPRRLADQLRIEFDIQLDAAADSDNAICPMFYDVVANGLTSTWRLPLGGGVFINPPYEDIWPWFAKALVEVNLDNCNRAVLLVPAAVGVKWFTEALKIAECHLFDERIKYELPPPEQLSEELRKKLYTPKGKPKTSPGGGNALFIIDRESALHGVTALRSAKTGRIVQDFVTGLTFDA